MLESCWDVFVLLFLYIDVEWQNKRIEEKQEDILQEAAKLKENRKQCEELAEHIQKLREELNKKKECKFYAGALCVLRFESQYQTSTITF